MPRLTEEQLAKLYPTAKTYDELQTKRAERDEIRRPKFVALKVGFQTSFGIATVAVAYYSTLHLIQANIPEAGSAQSTGNVMVAVFGMFFIGIVTMAVVYYMYSLATSLIHLTFAWPTRPIILLGGIIFLVAILFGLLGRYDYGALPVSALLIALNFVLASSSIALTSKE